jgi:hypothetical protein
VFFTLEALQAEHGDALLLHAGKPDSPELIVIDGGPTGVYKKTLKARLGALKAARGAGERLPIRLMMVSHIDDDHIHGILDLAQELVQTDTLGNELPYDIHTLWHNSFEAIVGDGPGKLSASIGAASIQAASAGDSVPDLDLSHHGALVLASVAQGNKLREAVKSLGLSLNAPFADLVTAPATGREDVDLGGGLTFTVLGPSAPRVDALRADWIKKIKTPKTVDPATAAAFVDTSVYNLSSIVVLATSGKRRMLLTGDGRGDFMIETLGTAGLLTHGKIKLDLLKIPHHGSVRDIDVPFFEAIVADHYVISANGKYDNPDLETLQILTKVRGNEPYTIHLTNPVPHALKFFEDDKAKNKGHKYNLVVREDKALSVKVDLATPFPH